VILRTYRTVCHYPGSKCLHSERVVPAKGTASPTRLGVAATGPRCRLGRTGPVHPAIPPGRCRTVRSPPCAAPTAQPGVVRAAAPKPCRANHSPPPHLTLCTPPNRPPFPRPLSLPPAGSPPTAGVLSPGRCSLPRPSSLRTAVVPSHGRRPFARPSSPRTAVVPSHGRVPSPCRRSFPWAVIPPPSQILLPVTFLAPRFPVSPVGPRITTDSSDSLRCWRWTDGSP